MLFKTLVLFALFLQVPWCASKDWDYLTFAQSWPSTTCTIWQQKGDSNSCNLASDHSTWTIHGVWPSKTGTKGPNNCLPKFDASQLKPLMPDLQKYWIDVQANEDPLSFWKYQWNKHGSCGVDLPQLNSVYKYFRQGLDWNRKYQLYNILAQGGVTPSSDGYTLQQLVKSIRAVTEKTPVIQCYTDKQTKESILSEIRICFNRNLQLIDCVSKQPAQDVINSNCDPQKIKYIGRPQPQPEPDDGHPVLITLFVLSLLAIIGIIGYFIYKKHRASYANF